MLTPGIHPNIPAEVYHAKVLGVASNSALKELRRSPAHYRAWLTGEHKETPALAFGKALHCGVIEPDVFAADYVVAPEFGDCRKTENKTRRDAWRNANASNIELSHADHEKLIGMHASIREHALVRACLDDPERASELTLVWEDEETSILCKARLDIWSPFKSAIVDLKSTEDASVGGFARSAANYGYHVQAAMYLDGAEALGLDAAAFLFAAVEKDPPFANACRWYGEDDIARGREVYRSGLRTLRRCLDADEWPGYESGPIELPRWAA